MFLSTNSYMFPNFLVGAILYYYYSKIINQSITTGAEFDRYSVNGGDGDLRKQLTGKYAMVK